MEVEHIAGVTALLEHLMDRLCERMAKRQPHGASQQRQHRALHQVLPEQRRSSRTEGEPVGGLAPSAHRPRQQQVGHIGAHDHEKHADEQHQNPERVRLANIDGIESASARHRDQLGNISIALGADEASEQAVHLRSRNILWHVRFQPAYLSNPPIAIILAMRIARAAARLKRHPRGERRVDIDPPAGPEAKESRRRHAHDANRNVVDPSAAVQRVSGTAKVAHPEAMADHHHGLAADTILIVAEGPARNWPQSQTLKEICADILQIDLLGRSIHRNGHGIRIGDRDHRLERTLGTRQLPVQIR